jgi:hypothetical protein
MKQTASPFQVASGTIPIRISVVISHLNQPALLYRCLRSLHQGVRRPDEIVVVDHGSAASPEALCRAYPSVQLFSEAALVPGPARNRGVAENSGDVLTVIDADCLADPAWGQRTTRMGYRIQYVAGMKLDHPARQTFSEVWKKWDWHSAHDYVAARQHPGGGCAFWQRPWSWPGRLWLKFPELSPLTVFRGSAAGFWSLRVWPALSCTAGVSWCVCSRAAPTRIFGGVELDAITAIKVSWAAEYVCSSNKFNCQPQAGHGYGPEAWI